VDTKEIVSQVALEWSRYGNFLPTKELQAINTETPNVVHNLHIQSPKSMLQSELVLCLKAVQEDLPAEYDTSDNQAVFAQVFQTFPSKSL
jgi:hypothetical protein